MKRSIFTGILAVTGLFAGGSHAQRMCGREQIFRQIQQEHPRTFRQLVVERQQRNASARPYAAKSTADQHPIPVVFHVIVGQAQYTTLGGDAGMLRRASSQLAGLNRDYNAENPDASLIPAPFKSLAASTGIRFGLANQTSAATIAPGIEVKILTTPPDYNVFNAYRDAKVNGAHGLAAWDPDKFLNVWVVIATGGTIGVTVSPLDKGATFGDRIIDKSDFGVVINFGSFGVRETQSQYFTPETDLGRTLTHEVGHFFELMHTWGDDDFDNVKGYCPGEKVNGQTEGFDDGITDTPPQAKRTYCTGGGVCPTFPLLDACSPTSPGVMFMNFMDYVDDRAMQLFTTAQAAVVRQQVAPGNPSYSLTQQPGLASVGVPGVSETAFSIYPNPASGNVRLSIGGSERLERIHLMSLTGQILRDIPATGSSSYEIETGNLARGLYFIQCRFAEGTLSRKIVLQ